MDAMNRIGLLVLTACIAAAAPLGHAATFNWNGGGGNWDTSTANWSGAGTTWPAVSSLDDDAVFGPAAGTVTLTTGITANDLRFSTTGYTVTGNVLTLNGTTPTITADSGVAATISSTIGGSAGLTKAGAGQVILNPSSAETYTGTTIVKAGTLTLDYSNMGVDAIQMLASGSALTYHATKAVDASVILRNSVGGGTTTQSFGTITNGRGTSMLLADPAAGTAMVINSTGVTLGGTRGWNGSNGTLIIGVMNAAQESQLTFNLTNTGSIDVGGIVTVPFLYTLDGGVDPANLYFAQKSGNVVSRRVADVNTTDTFTGTANTNQIRITTTTAGQSWTNTGDITAQKGVLFVGAHDYTISGGTFAANMPGTGTLNNRGILISTFGTGTLTITSLINGPSPGQLSKFGPGTLVLTHTANTYVGSTNVNGGVLSVSNIVNGGIASGIGQSDNQNSRLILGGGTLRYTGAATSTDRGFGVFGDSALDASGTGAIDWTNTGNLGFASNGPIHFTLTGTNTGDNYLRGRIIGGVTAPLATSVTKSGVGKWILTNANTYIGATHVAEGTLALSGSGSIDSSASIRIGAGAIFDVTAIDSFVYTMASTQPFTFDVNPAGAGTAGRLDASGLWLDISAATVLFNVLGTLDDAFYILADYGTLAGVSFASVTAPAGYSIDYNYLGGKIRSPWSRAWPPFPPRPHCPPAWVCSS